jgi:hypothetical protein
MEVIPVSSLRFHGLLLLWATITGVHVYTLCVREVFFGKRPLAIDYINNFWLGGISLDIPASFRAINTTHGSDDLNIYNSQI